MPASASRSELATRVHLALIWAGIVAQAIHKPYCRIGWEFVPGNFVGVNIPVVPVFRENLVVPCEVLCLYIFPCPVPIKDHFHEIRHCVQRVHRIRLRDNQRFHGLARHPWHEFVLCCGKFETRVSGRNFLVHHLNRLLRRCHQRQQRRDHCCKIFQGTHFCSPPNLFTRMSFTCASLSARSSSESASQMNLR